MRRAAGAATNWAPDEYRVGVNVVAAHVGVDKDFIYRWVESHGLPARMMGRLLRFRLSRDDAWVEAGGGEGNRGRIIAPRLDESPTWEARAKVAKNSTRPCRAERESHDR